MFIALLIPLLVILLFFKCCVEWFLEQLMIYCCVLLDYINVLLHLYINFMRFGDFKVV